MAYVKKPAATNKKNALVCLALIMWALLAGNLWRFLPPDRVFTQALSLYTEMLRDTTIVGAEFSALTTTLGNYAVKRSSENPVTAALMVRLLKDAGATPETVVAINASGSFPGFLLAALSACAALGIKPYVIASIGSSTFGANIPGNTVADILMQDNVRALGFTLLAVTPGGSGDHGLMLDEEELARVSRMLENHGIAFIVPQDLADAISLRETLFNSAGSTLLVNIGGGHASIGDDMELALASGVLIPEPNRTFNEAGLVQQFLTAGKPVIQILNVNRLYETYGLAIDRDGNFLGGTGNLYRRGLSPLLTLVPLAAALALLFVNARQRG